MSSSSVIWKVVVIGVIIVGVGVFSIRKTIKKTPESFKNTARQVSSGGHLGFTEGEGERIVLDLGTVGQADKTNYSFQLTNLGLTTVDIYQVEVVGGPAKVIDYPSSVPPSGESKIMVEFNPYGLRGDQEAVIRVISSDVKYSDRELVLQAKVSEGL